MPANNEDFQGGYQAGAFKPTSVLEANNVRPTGNGYGSSDRNRLLPGGTVLPTMNGRSESYNQTRTQTWMDRPRNPID